MCSGPTRDWEKRDVHGGGDLLGVGVHEDVRLLLEAGVGTTVGLDDVHVGDSLGSGVVDGGVGSGLLGGGLGGGGIEGGGTDAF